MSQGAWASLGARSMDGPRNRYRGGSSKEANLPLESLISGYGPKVRKRPAQKDRRQRTACAVGAPRPLRFSTQNGRRVRGASLLRGVRAFADESCPCCIVRIQPKGSEDILVALRRAPLHRVAGQGCNLGRRWGACMASTALD